MPQQIRVPGRRRTSPRKQPTPAAPPTRPAVDTSGADSMVRTIDKLLGRR